MARPADLPQFRELPCGTRAKYVAVKCRCPKCRAANSRYVVERDRLAKDAARELAADTDRSRRDWVKWRLSLDAVAAPRRAVPAASPSRCPQVWTAPDGTKRTRFYTRACRGIDGRGCPKHRHLRKDSTGEHCGDCRKALVWNGPVSADAVRAHLKRLSRQGVGYKSVAVAADISRTSLAKIIAGTKLQLRAQAARRVLAVDRDAVADHALVKADATWRRLRRLLREGFTKTELARRLGSKARTPALQFKSRYILAKSAARVERFYSIVMVA